MGSPSPQLHKVYKSIARNAIKCKPRIKRKLFLRKQCFSVTAGFQHKFGATVQTTLNLHSIGGGVVEVFTEYLAQIEHQQYRARTKEILDWVNGQFPALEPRVAWNQPMFTDHGTFIIGFSVAGKHLAISPERAGMERFTKEIAAAGYGQSKMLFRIQWQEPVNYPLLEQIIGFNRLDKADCKAFWRK